mmetsp:Transcript_20360/g.37979  ORF Transcript_20360/g.37979 Transcript_20360/m.37979 type:complete len:167 (+) Transcript_20360:54-554(+)
MDGGDPFGEPVADTPPAPLSMEPPQDDAAFSMPPAPVTQEPEVMAPVVDDFQAPDEVSPQQAFNSQWQQELASRKNAEETAKQTAITQASADLAKFTEERDATRESKMSKNRSEEQVKLEALEADLESTNPWERVVKLVDLQIDEGEVGRMRGILIQLKNEGIKSA